MSRFTSKAYQPPVIFLFALTVLLALGTNLYGQQEIEPNNSFQNANGIGVDTITGKLDTSQDVDYFSIEISEPGILSFNIDPPSGIGPELALYAPDRTTRLVRERSINSVDVYIDQLICEPGTYYLRVSRYNGGPSNQPYRLEVQFDTRDIYECNNNFASAAPIAIGDTIFAHFFDDEDVDYYAIEVPEAGILSFTIDPPNGIGPELAIYAPDRTTRLVRERSINSVDVYIDELICDPGTYYLRASRYNGGPSRAFYELRVQFDNRDIYECNNNFDSAAPIAPGNTIYGHFFDEEDVDYYAIVVTEPGVLSFTIDPPGIGVGLILFASDQETRLAEERMINSTDVYIDKLICDPGIYYLRAFRYNGSPSREFYALNVQFDTRDVYECNNDFDSAAPIPLGDTIYAHLFDEEDIDYYAFEVSQSGKLSFILEPPAGLRPEVRLFSAGSTAVLLEENGGFNGGPLSFEMEVNAPGAYVLEVSHYYDVGMPIPEFYRFLLSYRTSAASFTFQHYHPFFPEDPLLKIDAESIATNPIQLCADGSDASIFEVGFPEDESIDPGDILLRIAEESGGSNANLYGVFQNLAPAGGVARFAFTHPRFLDDQYAEALHGDLTLEIYDQKKNVVHNRIPIRVYRPPVLLVHGLASKGENLIGLKHFLVKTKSNLPELILAADYAATNDEEFAVNKDVVPYGISDLILAAKYLGIAAKKADVIGHSMGGILARLYLQSDQYDSDINKLITLNTPHSGSQVANYIFSFNSNATRLKLLCGLLWLADYADATDLNCLDGAIHDLQVDSDAICNDLNGERLNANIVPSHAIVTVHDNFWKEAFLNRIILNTSVATLFDLEPHDFVVALSSQKGGLPNSAVSEFTNIHTGSFDNEDVQKRIRSLLNQDPENLEFSPIGFAPPKLEYIEPVPFDPRQFELDIFSSMENEYIEYGSALDISLNSTATTVTLFFNGMGILSYHDSEETFSASNFQIMRNIRPSKLGRIPISAYGYTTNPDEGTGIDTMFVYVTTTKTPISIFGNDRTVKAEQIFNPGIEADFGDFKVIISAVAGIEYHFEKGLAEYIGNGYILPLKEGIEVFTVSFNGVESEPITLRINKGEMITSVASEQVRPKEDIRFSISPNPVENRLNIKFASARSGELVMMIHDMLSRKLLQEQMVVNPNEPGLSLDISMLSDGPYVLSVSDGRHYYSAKFIKH